MLFSSSNMNWSDNCAAFHTRTVDSHTAQLDADDRRPWLSPMIVTQSFLVTSTTLSIRLFVPLAKLSHSNTPTGPFHTICLALWTASALALVLSGPQSKPCSEGSRSMRRSSEPDRGQAEQNVASPSSRRGFLLRRLRCRWWLSRQTFQR